MTNIIARVFIIALALLIVAELPIGVEIDSLYSALIAALILGILNAVVRPILLVLTLPITVLTLGLFILVINASLFYFAALFVEGFYVSGFVAALLGSLLVSLVSTVGNRFIK